MIVPHINDVAEMVSDLRRRVATLERPRTHRGVLRFYGVDTGSTQPVNTIPSGQWRKIFVSAVIDDQGAYSAGAWYAPRDCRVWVQGSVRMDSGSGGIRGVRIEKSGSAVPGSGFLQGPGPIGQTTINSKAVVVDLAEGESVNLAAYQSSGSDLDTYVGGEDSSTLTVWG